MNVFKHFEEALADALDALGGRGEIPADVERRGITVEPPRDAAHGDLATNAAMVLAKRVGSKPRDLAEKIAEELRGRLAPPPGNG